MRKENLVPSLYSILFEQDVAATAPANTKDQAKETAEALKTVLEPVIKAQEVAAQQDVRVGTYLQKATQGQKLPSGIPSTLSMKLPTGTSKTKSTTPAAVTASTPGAAPNTGGAMSPAELTKLATNKPFVGALAKELALAQAKLPGRKK